MKKPIDLSPSIEHIERRRLGINEGLIQAVMRGETSAAVATAVRAAPEWARFQNNMAEMGEGPEIITGRPSSLLPDHLQDLIRRRAAVQALQTCKSPESGQIVRVDKLVTPRPQQFDAVLMAPLYVLLDAPAESPVLWHGWLAAGETDYAGWWDFVLQEQDAPFEPEAAMVQLWNPVRLYLPQAAKVVGCLSLARLQAVRSLAGDFVTSAPPTDLASWPGRIANRITNSGLPVVTGSPLGSTHDLRHQYQQIYFEAAEAVREPARLALRELAQVRAPAYVQQPDTTSPLDDLWSTITRGIGSILDWIAPEPVPQITYAALSGNRSFRFRFDGPLEGTLDVKICAEDCTVELVPDIYGDTSGWFLIIAYVRDGTALPTVEGNSAIALAKYYPDLISVPVMKNIDDIDARMVKISDPE